MLKPISEYKYDFTKGLKEIVKKIENEREFWSYLSSNPNAIHLLEKNLDKVVVDKLLRNTYIFVNVYEQVCRDYFKQCLTEELTRLMFHPKNIDKFKDWGFEE